MGKRAHSRVHAECYNFPRRVGVSSRRFRGLVPGFPMWLRRPRFSTLLLLFVFFVSAVGPASATQKHVTHKPAVPETTVEVVPPPPPPRPEQMPAVPPQVMYQNGKLTIIARNSTLGDILRGVHAKTGALIDIPGSAPERVVGQFGPGPARDVIASLLNGSHFNYVMLGSEGHPEQLAHLILTPKTGGGTTSPATQSPSQPVQAQNQPVPTAPEPDAQDANADDFGDDTADADAVDQQAPDDQQQGQQVGQPNAKTPEQLLLELQRQQALQQQQQQQQQQGGAPVPSQGFPPVPPGAQRPNPPQ